MKKDRNFFFNESGMSNVGYYPNQVPNMNMGYNNVPVQSSQASFNSYAGPYPVNGNDMAQEIESRIAKIERQINRLDSRVTKLESESHGIDTTEINTNSMYMI